VPPSAVLRRLSHKIFNCIFLHMAAFPLEIFWRVVCNTAFESFVQLESEPNSTNLSLQTLLSPVDSQVPGSIKV
jgi:hypothetical protein